MKQNVLSVLAVKGGTGKTTTAGALAMAAAAAGRRVLCIDLDPQANLSIWLKGDFSRPGSCQLLDGQQAAETIQDTESGISLICGNADLIAVKTYPGSAQRVNEALTGLQRKYDYIFIDTGPSMGELQNLALCASTGVIIPLHADSYSLQALYQAADIIDQIRTANEGLQALGVLFTQYDGRANVTRYLQQTIAEAAAGRGVPFLGTVRKGVVIQEAQAMQQDLYSYAPNSKPAQDYKEIFERIKKEIRRGGK